MKKLTLASANRSQTIVVGLAIIAVAIIVVQRFFFHSGCPQTSMCPAHDYAYLYRVGLVVVAAAIAVWLLKSRPQD